ncbi:hypothetical protein CN116_31580, partial [Sinorhizobium meliloti]
TTAPPPAHYGAVEGALASGFATAELHHLWGHDPWLPERAAKARLRGCTRRLQLYGGLPRVRLIESLYFTTLMTSFIVINPGLVYMSVACHGGADEAHCRVGK